MNLLTVPYKNETDTQENNSTFKVYEFFEFYPNQDNQNNRISLAIRESARRIKRILNKRIPAKFYADKYLVIRLNKKKMKAPGTENLQG